MYFLLQQVARRRLARALLAEERRADARVEASVGFATAEAFTLHWASRLVAALWPTTLEALIADKVRLRLEVPCPWLLP
jgi:hypothetical protein